MEALTYNAKVGAEGEVTLPRLHLDPETLRKLLCWYASRTTKEFKRWPRKQWAAGSQCGSCRAKQSMPSGFKKGKSA